MSSREATIQSLLSAFPNEKEVIQKYFQLIEAARVSMRGFVALKFLPTWIGKFLVMTGLVYWFTDYFKYASRSVTDVLNSLTSNQALKAVLAYNFGDYGTIPKDAPFSMHAALQNHFLRGVSYPIGGSSEIGFHIIPTITSRGGGVFVRAEVDQIITNDNGTIATGVRMKRDGNIISAPIIISDAGLINTANLLPRQASSRLENMLRHVSSGTGGLSVYVGLKGTAKELNLEGKHYWAMWTKSGQEDLDEIVTKYLKRSKEEIATAGPVPLLFISFPSAKDPLWESKHPNKSTATIVTFANYEWFKDWEKERVMHRGEEYEEMKRALGELIWNQTVSLFPQLKDKVEYFDVGTPITNKYYLAANGGEMYVPLLIPSPFLPPSSSLTSHLFSLLKVWCRS
jgi:all-trans-retinol 13,14-reductase